MKPLQFLQLIIHLYSHFSDTASCTCLDSSQSFSTSSLQRYLQEPRYLFTSSLQRYLGEPSYSCKELGWCFVPCAGTCRDKTEITGILAGHCKSAAACLSYGTEPSAEDKPEKPKEEVILDLSTVYEPPAGKVPPLPLSSLMLHDSCRIIHIS